MILKCLLRWHIQHVVLVAQVEEYTSALLLRGDSIGTQPCGDDSARSNGRVVGSDSRLDAITIFAFPGSSNFRCRIDFRSDTSFWSHSSLWSCSCGCGSVRRVRETHQKNQRPRNRLHVLGVLFTSETRIPLTR